MMTTFPFSCTHSAIGSWFMDFVRIAEVAHLVSFCNILQGDRSVWLFLLNPCRGVVSSGDSYAEKYTSDGRKGDGQLSFDDSSSSGRNICDVEALYLRL